MIKQEAIEKVAGVLSRWMDANWYEEAAAIVDALHPEWKSKYRVYVLTGKISVASNTAEHLKVLFGPDRAYTKSEAWDLAQRECDRLNERD